VKLTKNQLRVLRNAWKGKGEWTNYQVVKKLKEKGLIRGSFGSFCTSKEGDKILRSVYGNNF
jgi:hypothetical protein